MDTAKELQVLREELIREIDEKIGQMLKKLQNENGADHQKNRVQTKVYESVYPLNMGTGIYKGKRPTAVIFPGEARKEHVGNTKVDLSGKVDKVDGMGLSANSFTDEEKAKLAGIEFATDTEVQEMLDEVFGTAETV